MSRDGDASVHGLISLRGGAAPDAGGTGGDGGPLYIYTDSDADGIGGNLTIESDGVLDVSGGPGTHGGNATSNGKFGVDAFPDGRRSIAILLNSDTAPAELTDGVIQNLGKIIAAGGDSDGWGGDLVFHGRRAGQDADPLPGDIDVSADGSGMDGQWYMQ